MIVRECKNEDLMMYEDVKHSWWLGFNKIRI